MGRVFFNTRKNVHALDGAYTVLASDSGKTFMLSATGGTVAITLPTTLEEGLHYKFVTLEDTPSNAITIGAGSAIIGTALGPYSPGSAYVLLHHYMGEVDGTVGAWGY